MLDTGKGEVVQATFLANFYCSTTLLHCKLMHAVVQITPRSWPTCHAVKFFVASCDVMQLQKVESTTAPTCHTIKLEENVIPHFTRYL